MGYIHFCDMCGLSDVKTSRLWVSDGYKDNAIQLPNFLLGPFDICENCKAEAIKKLKEVFRFAKA